MARRHRTYHLENPNPRDRTLLLDQQYPSGLVIVEGAERSVCDLFSAVSPDPLEQGRGSGRIFSPVVRVTTVPAKPRDGAPHRIGSGDTTFFGIASGVGKRRSSSVIICWEMPTGRPAGSPRMLRAAAWGRADGRPGPQAASIDPKYADRLVLSTHLGIRLEDANATRLIPGVWYAALSNPGIYVSILPPNFIAHEILQRRDSAADQAGQR